MRIFHFILTLSLLFCGALPVYAQKPPPSTGAPADAREMTAEGQVAALRQMQFIERCMIGDNTDLDKATLKKLTENRKEAEDAIEIVYKKKGAATLLEFANKIYIQLQQERMQACSKAAGMDIPVLTSP